MQLEYTTKELEFRDYHRALLRRLLPDALAERHRAGKSFSPEEERGWQQTLDSHGLAVPNWPVQHGGRDWTPVERHLYEIEYARADAPDVNVFGTGLVGPVIYTFGSEEMKARILPLVRREEVLFCQGFSEPGAGSDLASLKTTAKRDGGKYIINGSKIWTSYAQYADLMFCLARTDSNVKPQAGISMLIVPMNSPGLTVRPIKSIDDFHHLNQVFFDDVIVDCSALIGEENAGWSYAKFLLDNEKTFNARVGRLVRIAERIEEAFRASVSVPTALTTRAASIIAQIHVFEWTVLRARQSESEAGNDQIKVAALKVTGTELMNASFRLLLELGMYQSNSGFAEDDASRKRQDIYWRASTIFGGSNDIQRSVVWKTMS